MIDPITGMLVGTGAGLISDLLDAQFGDTKAFGGSSLTESLGGGGSNVTPYEASLLAQEKMKAQIPGLIKSLNWNAMGQSGEAARQGADIALGNWGNTNKAVNASNAMNQDANRLRGLAQSTGQQALKSSQSQSAKGRDSLINMLSRSGASPASIAAVAAKVSAEQSGQNNNIMQQAMQQQAGNLAQAGGLTGQSNQVLQNDLQTQFEKVKPYLNNMQDLGSAMSNITNAGQAATSNLVESKKQTQSESRPLFETLQALGGKIGSDFTSQGVYSLFNQQPVPTEGTPVPEDPWLMGLT